MTEKRNSLIDPTILWNFNFTMIFLVNTLTYGAVVSFIALYATQKGIANIGLFFTVYAVTLTAIRPVSGIIADRKGFDIVVIPGIILIFLAMLSLSWANGLGLFLLAGVLYGLGFGTVQPSMQALAVKDVQPMRRGAANSTLFSSFDLGIGIGAVLWGAVSQALGYSTMYMLAGIPALIALFIYMLLREKRTIENKGVL